MSKNKSLLMYRKQYAMETKLSFDNQNLNEMKLM